MLTVMLCTNATGEDTASGGLGIQGGASQCKSMSYLWILLLTTVGEMMLCENAFSAERNTDSTASKVRTW